MNKKRILILNYEYPPLGGGAGNALSYILKEFAHSSDFQFDVVVASADKYHELQFAPHITVYQLNINKKNRRQHYQTNYDIARYLFFAFFFAKKLCKKYSYFLCHAFFGIPCGFIAMLLGIPYIVSLRGSDVPYYNKRFHLLDTFFLQHLSRIIWKRAIRVIANSQGLKELATHTAKTQEVKVIENGVDTQAFYPAARQCAAVRLLCVSRLIARKGVSYLLEALASLNEREVTLTLVGEGDKKLAFQRRVRELGIAQRVVFLGYVPHQQLPHIYNRHNVFVSPSLNEGMSNALLEAMACGLAVIITDTGGTRELFEGNGFLVKKQDVSSLAEAIQQCLNDPQSIIRMGNKSREIAQKLSWYHTAQKYRQVYQSIRS